MIAFQNHLPLVQNSEGIVVAFQLRWLQQSLEQAAQQAGYGGWWLADDLAQSVTFYLANCYPKNTIPETQLEEAVRLALWEIGYGEIARFFGSRSDSMQVSLLRLLPPHQVSAASFFERLAAHIEFFQSARASQFHFCDLQTCISLLLKNGIAAEPSDIPTLRNRIVDFVRAKVEATPWSQNVHCSIS